MLNKIRPRYLVAVYLIVLLLAVLALQLARHESDTFWSGALLNVGTELLGVVLVFFVVDTLFLKREWDLVDRVDSLVAQLKKPHPPSAQLYFVGLPNMGLLIKGHSTIDLCGVSLTSAINRNLTTIREGLSMGRRFRVMILDPRTNGDHAGAAEHAGIRSETGDSTYFHTRLAATIRDLQYLHQSLESDRLVAGGGKASGDLQVRYLNYVPGFGIAGFDMHLPAGQIYVEIYPSHRVFSEHAVLRLTEDSDGSWYTQFRSQFEVMWERACPWDPS